MTEVIKPGWEKYIGISKLYRCVYLYEKDGATIYRAQIRRMKVYHSSIHTTERQAALKVDMILIEHQLEPVNILKRKV